MNNDPRKLTVIKDNVKHEIEWNYKEQLSDSDEDWSDNYELASTNIIRYLAGLSLNTSAENTTESQSKSSKSKPDLQSSDRISLLAQSTEGQAMRNFAGESEDYSDDFELDETQSDLEQGVIQFFQSFALRKEDDEVDPRSKQRNSW